MLTSLFAGSPFAVKVRDDPGRAWSGVDVRMVMFGDGVAAGATGPGRAGTPGIAGGVVATGSARAEAGSSRAPARTRPAKRRFRVRKHLPASRVAPLISSPPREVVVRSGRLGGRDDRQLRGRRRRALVERAED